MLTTPCCRCAATPRQGFAPQFSEVEVFALQLEGSAHWRLYAPASVDDLHPTEPSHDLHQKSLGEPFLDVQLAAGDLLYIPSGVIFQTTNPSTTTTGLELRLSTGAGMSYRDLLASALPRALDLAASEDVTMRRALPSDFLSYMGVSFAGGTVAAPPPAGLPPALHEEYSVAAKDEMRRRAEARTAFQQQLTSMSEKVLAALPLDTAADQLAKRQLIDYRLPPAFSRRQLRGCHHGPGVKEQVVINEGSWVRLCSRGAVRLCIEDNASNSPGSQDTVTLYHCLDNATEGTVQYAGRPLYADRGVVFSMEFAPAIDHIITQYPRYVPVVRTQRPKMAKGPLRHLAHALRSLAGPHRLIDGGLVGRRRSCRRWRGWRRRWSWQGCSSSSASSTSDATSPALLKNVCARGTQDGFCLLVTGHATGVGVRPHLRPAARKSPPSSPRSGTSCEHNNEVSSQ